MKKIEEIKSNPKSVMISIILLICFFVIIFLTVIYTQNGEIRNWVDRNIFRKIVSEDDTIEIELDSDNNPSVYAYSNYVTILSENELVTYINGKKEYTLGVNVSNPIYSSAGEYMVIADGGKQQAYLISGKNIIWNTEIEGNISNVYVNKHGYVAITIVDTSYKTVIAVYNSSGKEILKKYLATTNVVDVEISEDSSYLAIAEIDTSGILIQSKVEIISIEKAQKNSGNPIVYTHNSKQGNMITSINYNNKNYLTCMYDNSIYIIKNNEEELLLELDIKKDVFSSVELDNHVLRIQENSLENISSNSTVYIKNILNMREKSYIIESAIKGITYYEDMAAINVGTEVYFLNTSGNLVKKYTSNREIRDIVLTDKISVIIYRDKIKIIDL